MARSTNHPDMVRAYNVIETSGQFGFRYRLSTYTIHYNAVSERFYVTDDHDSHRTVGAGYRTLDEAQRAHQWSDDHRMGRDRNSRD